MAWVAAAPYIASAVGGILGGLGNRKGGPSLAENMSNMYGLFGQGSGFNAAAGYRDLGPAQYYPGQTLAPLSGQTQAGIASLFGRGQQGSPGVNAGNNYLGGLLGGQYLNANPANPQLGQMAGAHAMGGFDSISPQLQQIAGQAGSFYANPAAGGLGAFGGGAELGSNPYLDSMYGAATRGVADQFRNSIAPSLSSAFSAAGRTGSGAHQGAFGQAAQSLGNTLGDMGANLYGGAYESGRNRQLSALNSMGGLYNQGIQNQMGALGALNQSFNQGFSNQLGALDQLGRNYNVERGLQNQGLGQVSQFAQAGQNMDYQNINAMLQAGGLLDANAQNQINDQRARFDAGQNAPRDYFSSLVGLYGGAPQTRIQQPYQQPYNTAMGVLGGALAGSRIGGMFGGGSDYSPTTSPDTNMSGFMTPMNPFGAGGGNINPFGSFNLWGQQ